ncbi:DNA-directed RNA polymerase i subunit rpa1 [Phtheirospermum japonicum]|uniref:DNA-directed RNA polymerase subunit n=1 Tax=Phtheirospermum japonicum TaxID=374723 RepID=A0A830BQZ8_9LAMI|nr:DNA-directed RNA polymerase i subunit rpa1 [Phtheirospermum japonicum]
MGTSTTDVVRAVKFGFMSDEEVRRQSLVKITNPNLVDILDKPIPGGLYDPAMGPLGNDDSPCKSCGQRSYLCPGHCGHIDLVSPVYNPLLFSTLRNLLNTVCFYCFHFRNHGKPVKKCVARLDLIGKGDNISESNNMSLRDNLETDDDISDPDDDCQGSQKSHSVVLSDGENYNHEDNTKDGASWDSCQLTEAMAILNGFLKKTKEKCNNCECKSGKVKTPTFGWFQMGVSSIARRANAIRSNSSGEDKPSSEVVNTSDYDSETAETNSVNAFASDSSKKGVNEKGELNQGSEENTDNLFSGPLLPSEVRAILRRLWENEAPLCSYISDIQRRKSKISGDTTAGYSMFFLETILVPPIKFRPPARGGNSVMEHPHTVLLGKVLQWNIALRNAHINNSERSKIIGRSVNLQLSINVLFDSNTATSQGQKNVSGICQYLEHKEGIFRKKMMGKRVNFSCRSVISPDPYLAVNEIGIPPYFALRLTYPERVTPWNVGKLRAAIINGPEVHPGATTYVDSVGPLKLSENKKLRVPISRKLPSSRGGKMDGLDLEGKIVYRHLQDGDIVLVNRQPTLHKPSLMAHVVRVLEGENTLRMHYANCSSYNADFDGDEINVHFPQDEISRAEAYNIVNANEQYIVPTRGDTVRGLIQDHIVGAVLLTMKNTFLTWSEFSQLLYGSGVFSVGPGPGSLPLNHSHKVLIADREGFVQSVLPAVWKPVPLWTGKQVITALLNHITRGCAPCTVKNEGKVPKTYYFTSQNGEEDEDHHAENELLIWKNELVRGVIDKAQFGKFGLVHTVQELYGSNSAGILLSALSRLFTTFLQINGFTCGLDDLIILPYYDLQRKEKLQGEDVGEEVHCVFVKFKPGQIGPEELQLEIEKAICSDRESATASLDMKMKNKLTNRLTREGSQILKHLLTAGLLKPFPKNCISVMTTTGAKGSTVNFQQISGYLGQQELEGKRVPRMTSGKTLPSFPPWDFTSRAGGFITDCFLSGLRPQEYYFHCMAGREGLVDTAVKTSRSGYLQRCLIKNLESLKVCYDYTVRDSDGSIVQFYYGDDGVDAHRTSFLKNFKALEDNQETISQKFQNQREFNSYISKLPEGLEEEARHFIQEKPNAESGEHIHKKRKVSKKANKACTRYQEKFLGLVKQKYLSSLAQPGEAVGIIAAQSVGEPSTQMTLNTFHLAGRGEMNVTLGIPRLQEILMTASRNIKTPILTCPFSQWRLNVKKVTVADLVEYMDVRISIERHHTNRNEEDIRNSKDEEIEHKVETFNVRNVDEELMSEGESSVKNGKPTPEKTYMWGDKILTWVVYMDVKGLSFEAHFRFTRQPHLLLAQIAQKIAKKVYINKRSSVSIRQCKMVQYDPDEKSVLWDEKKKPKASGSGVYWAMKASSIDFSSFWEMDGRDDLDLTRLYSNNIHAMLNTYGVEAARATLIREVSQVFDMYGVKIDYRHLSLIADYMTHTGGYRPMSRRTITDSVSPFLKMSYETASKFIVEAAANGLSDNLESPSSRI